MLLQISGVCFMAQKVLYWSMVHVSLRRMFSLWLLNEVSIAVHCWWCCQVQLCPYDFLNTGSVHFWQRTVKVSSWIKLPLQAYQLFPCMAGPLLLVTNIQYLYCVSFQRAWRHTFSQAVTSTAVKTGYFLFVFNHLRSLSIGVRMTYPSPQLHFLSVPLDI